MFAFNFAQHDAYVIHGNWSAHAQKPHANTHTSGPGSRACVPERVPDAEPDWPAYYMILGLSPVPSSRLAPHNMVQTWAGRPDWVGGGDVSKLCAINNRTESMCVCVRVCV